MGFRFRCSFSERTGAPNPLVCVLYLLGGVVVASYAVCWWKMMSTHGSAVHQRRLDNLMPESLLPFRNWSALVFFCGLAVLLIFSGAAGLVIGIAG